MVLLLAAQALLLPQRVAATESALPLAWLEAGLVVLIFLALASQLERRVAGPVEDLLRAAERRARGERGVRAPVRVGDEIGAVARAWNAAGVALDESEARLESVIASIGDGTLEWDPATDRMRFSSRFRELVGLEGIAAGEQDAPFAVFESALHPDDRAPTFAAMQAHLESDAPYRMEFRLRGAGGGWRWFESRATTLRDDSGRPLRVVGSITDVDDLRRAEEAARARTAEVEQVRDRIAEQARHLEALNQELSLARDQALEAARVKAAFLSNVSHEIRTPLHAVLGNTAILLDGPLEPEQREAARTLREAGDHLLGLVESILDFSHLEEGTLQLAAADLEPRVWVEQCLAEVQPQAARKGLRLETRFDPALPPLVRSDPGRLRQVLGHLLANAVKFTEHGGVTVSVSAEPEAADRARLRVAVADTGIGIPEAEQGRLFQPFVQAEDAEDRRFGGTGLGLAICRKLVEILGGGIEVESAPGDGACFRFHLPVEVRQASASVVLASAELRGLRALVLGAGGAEGAGRGASGDGALLRAQLEGLGVEVEAAGDAGEALARARKAAREGRPFELVFVGGALAAEDALSLPEELAAEPETASLRAFLLSTRISRRAAAQARRAGYAGSLALPARQSHLHDCILAALPERPGRSEAGPDAPGRAVRVLVAEDNAVNQKLARRMLERMGFEVVLAENGIEAVRAMAAGGYDAVLMDCQMPRMDGFEATREIRRREAPGSRVPIIAVTANAMPGDRERCLAAGMDDYVPKPVKRDALTQALRRWLETPDGARRAPRASA